MKRYTVLNLFVRSIRAYKDHLTSSIRELKVVFHVFLIISFQEIYKLFTNKFIKRNNLDVVTEVISVIKFGIYIIKNYVRPGPFGSVSEKLRDVDLWLAKKRHNIQSQRSTSSELCHESWRVTLCLWFSNSYDLASVYFLLPLCPSNLHPSN